MKEQAKAISKSLRAQANPKTCHHGNLRKNFCMFCECITGGKKVKK
jgi:hypothetical protein